MCMLIIDKTKICCGKRERPYQHDSTASRLLSEVKHVRAWFVLRWGTTLESQVLFSSFLSSYFYFDNAFYFYSGRGMFVHPLSTVVLSYYTSTSIPQFTYSTIPSLTLYYYLFLYLLLRKGYFCSSLSYSSSSSSLLQFIYSI